MKKINNRKRILDSKTSFGEIFKRFLVAWFLLLFFVVFINQQESFLIKSSSYPEQIIFVFSGSASDWGIKDYQKRVHGSANDWSYLFEEEVGELSSDLDYNNNVNDEIDINVDKDFFPSDYDFVYEGMGESENQIYDNETDNIENMDIEDKIEYSICVTPWGEYVAHGDFVLAYQQRDDVDNICNVQRRFCYDGNLNGIYKQKSCRENTFYSYVRPEAISYTEKPLDPFIQPNKPSLSGANFDNHGKINGTLQAIDIWGADSNGDMGDTNFGGQEILKDRDCITPWGEPINDGQFVKAYKSSIGLIDLPCDVEIRLCVGGKLKGSYENRTCSFKNMTYRDFLYENYDIDSPNIGDLINSFETDENKSKYKTRSFWKWLDKYF